VPLLIDWHSHHTAPELVEKLASLGGRKPRIDDYDSPDFSKRVKEMDEVGLDLQLVCQGAGVHADFLPPDQAMEMVRESNNLLAQRLNVYRDRLMGVMAISLKNAEGSVAEIDRMAARGFRAVLMYSGVNGEVLVDRPESEPLLAKIAELDLPIFLHGGGGRIDPSLKRLEDGGAGVSASALADAGVSECVVRMIASGVFDRHPNLHVVIRSGGGGIPLLLNKLFWKHKGPSGEKRYSEVLLEHFLVDTAGVNPRTLQFLMDTLGSDRVVFGSDYCGGLGPLQKAMPVVDEQPDPNSIKFATERNSRRLLHI